MAKKLSFSDYMKRFVDDRITVKGAVARRVCREKEKGREIDSLTSLMIWLCDGKAFTEIEQQAYATERLLGDIWAEYCAATDQPIQ